jgi:hypothetical protein
MGVNIEKRIFGKNWKKSGIYLNMKLHEEVLRIRELLGEEKEQKIFRVPGLEFFHEDPWKAWQILQKVLEHRGNPPYTIGGNLDLEGTPIESLGNLISVEGYLDLSNTPIEYLENLESVGVNLFLINTPLSKKYTEEEIRQMVDVGGDIYL